jgi:hypothetical protein
MSALARGFVIACIVLSTGACNGNDEKTAPAPSTTVEGQATWLGTGGPCEDLPGVEADKEMKENLGQVYCGNAGKTFTGEMRCARDFIEVSCR